MKKTILAAALLMSSPAIAQTSPIAAATDPTTVVAVDVTPATSPIAWPSNADPEISARGIPVISDPAVVPPTWNGVVVTAVGGPLIDPTTGEVIEAENVSYPPCTAMVTDNCVQAYAQPD